MKVLVVTGIFPPDIGGPASYVPRIAGALTARGHAVDVVTLADAQTSHESTEFPFAVHRIARQTSKPVRMFKAIFRIAALARRADVVFANGLYIETMVAARIASRPVVAKVVGDTIWERARNEGRPETIDAFQSARLPRKWRALRILQDAYMRGAKRVITPSAYLRRIVTGWGVSAERIDVVYNAVPLASPDCGAPPQFDVVSVGRLVPWKGFAELIDLVAHRKWSLRIVGDGPLRAELENQAAAAGAQVRFDGDVPQALVAAAIRSGKVFVLNSSYEGLPHIVLEAMAAGVPVIATAAGGTPEVVRDGETGILVPVGSREQLERAVERLLGDDSLRQHMVTGAGALLGEKFSFATMVEDTERVLAAVVKRCPAEAGAP